MMRAALRLAVQRCGLSASVSMSMAGGVVVALDLLMAETSMLKVNGDKGEWVATAQKLCYGSAAASSRYARRYLRYAFTELLRGVDVCLILDQFGELITCPIQEGDGAAKAWATSD